MSGPKTFKSNLASLVKKNINKKKMKCSELDHCSTALKDEFCVRETENVYM